MRVRPWSLALLSTILLSCAETGTEPDPTPPVVTPASISLVGGSGQTATVGTALPTAVTVEVRGSNGQALAGAAVTFTASNGGSANPATGTTGSNGRLATTWTLGSTVTSQTLTASAGGSVTTSATATATSASVSIASITLVSGSGQSGTVSTALGTPIVFEVRGSNGLPYQYANVTFAASNQGSVSPATPTSNAAGRVSVTWTLGSTVTTQSLTAYAGSFTANVTATATANPCVTATALTLGNTVNGSLASGDCATLPTGTGGTGYTDRFAITRPAGSVMEQYDVTSTAFDTYLRLRDSSGRIVAENDDRISGNTNSRVILYTTTGALTAELTSYSAGSTGAYALVTGTTTAHPGVSCGFITWVMRGTNISGQTLNTADCTTTATTGNQAGGTRYFRRYYLYLVPGQSATITQGGDFDSFLIVRDVAAGTLGSDDDSGGGTAGLDSRLVITAPGTGTTPRLYYVDATTYAPGVLGTYFITVN